LGHFLRVRVGPVFEHHVSDHHSHLVMGDHGIDKLNIVVDDDGLHTFGGIAVPGIRTADMRDNCRGEKEWVS
jgi:hypothetical protein